MESQSPREAYPSDQRDVEWAALEALVPAVKPGGRPARRRLSQDYEYELESSEALIYVAMSHLVLRRLTRRVEPLSRSAGS